MSTPEEEEEPKLEKISEDERGENWRVLFPDSTELVLIFTKKGGRRGGHSHDVEEVSLLLSGEAEYHKTTLEHPEKEEVFVQRAGDALRNRPGEIHMMEALSDNLVVDWKLGLPAGQWTTTDYEPYRRLVGQARKPR